MGHVLSTVYADLYDEFLAAERPRVTTQGFVSLQGRARRMLQWFEDEDIELLAVGI